MAQEEGKKQSPVAKYLINKTDLVKLSVGNEAAVQIDLQELRVTIQLAVGRGMTMERLNEVQELFSAKKLLVRPSFNAPSGKSILIIEVDGIDISDMREFFDEPVDLNESPVSVEHAREPSDLRDGKTFPVDWDEPFHSD